MICTADGFWDGKMSNAASSPQQLSGPLLVVGFCGLADDKFDAWLHE